MTDTMPAARVIAAARGWLGTPYHHQASLRGVGTDCLGLLRGMYAELYQCPVPHAPAYTRDWAEATGEEALLAAANRYLVRAPLGSPVAGDVLCFRYLRHFPVKHVGIAVEDDRLIHAIERDTVREVALVPAWRRRVAAIYRFPMEKK